MIAVYTIGGFVKDRFVHRIDFEKFDMTRVIGFLHQTSRLNPLHLKYLRIALLVSLQLLF